VGPLLDRAYIENVTLNPQLPSAIVPKLLPTATPVHRVVKVDVFCRLPAIRRPDLHHAR